MARNRIGASLRFTDSTSYEAYGNAVYDPENAAQAFTRYMGIPNLSGIRAINLVLTPEGCSGGILRVLFGYPPEEIRSDDNTGMVITVPAAAIKCRRMRLCRLQRLQALASAGALRFFLRHERNQLRDVYKVAIRLKSALLALIRPMEDCMKTLILVFCLMAFLFAGFMVGSAQAADLSKAQNTVDRIRPPDPPQVSTTTKPSPVGQPISNYKPPATPSLKIKEPPPPAPPPKKK